MPKNERHGTVWHAGPLWFMSNAATLAVGTTSSALSGNLVWLIIALVIAIALGLVICTIFMAAHSSRGPKLGLP